MKTKLSVIQLTLAALMLVCPLGGVMVLTSGCSTTAEGHDSVVVNAERSAKLAFFTVDAFLQFENENRGTIPPEMTDAADTLRDHFPKAYDAFRQATKAYKTNRTADNKANVNTALAVVEKALSIAYLYLPPPQRALAELKADTTPTLPLPPTPPTKR